MYHVIIAGGSGTRFWPKSTENNPKQLLNIFGDKTMIRQTVDRIKEIDNPEKIFVVAKNNLLEKIKLEITEIPVENFILEPSGKNTAPAIGLAAMHLLRKNKEGIMAIYPADHFISGKNFKKTILSGSDFAKNNSGLITIGIEPTYPATGYGYINIDKQSDDSANIYSVKKFIEKPSSKDALILLEQGNNYWNSGIFIWSIKSIIDSFQQHMSNLYGSLSSIYRYIDTEEYHEKLNLYWDEIIPESIDYGILEKEMNIYLIPGEFTWSDLGNWKSLYDLLTENGNDVIKGNIVSIDSFNNLIISPNRLTATIGVENMAIINVENKTLIMPLEDSEKVKELVEKLKKSNSK